MHALIEPVFPCSTQGTPSSLRFHPDRCSFCHHQPKNQFSPNSLWMALRFYWDDGKRHGSIYAFLRCYCGCVRHEICVVIKFPCGCVRHEIVWWSSPYVAVSDVRFVWWWSLHVAVSDVRLFLSVLSCVVSLWRWWNIVIKLCVTSRSGDNKLQATYKLLIHYVQNVLLGIMFW